MAPHAEPIPDSGVDLIQHDASKQYGDWRDEFHKTGVAIVKGVITPERKGMQCVQGLLNYQPNGPKDGGLIVMKGSSKLFDQFFKESREQDDHEDKPPEEENFRDLFIFKEEDVKWFEKRGCEMIKVNLEPGDLVLWDSRTMHYACFPEGDLIRHVQYICMTPTKFAKQEDLDLKAELFRTWQGTTHWPHW